MVDVQLARDDAKETVSSSSEPRANRFFLFLFGTETSLVLMRKPSYGGFCFLRVSWLIDAS
jgi:hypothetical protein